VTSSRSDGLDCGGCRFFDVIVFHESDEAPAESGQPGTICRRFPPMDGWPTVLEDDWCGEWRGRDDG
jgi:hypothetical protein